MKHLFSKNITFPNQKGVKLFQLRLFPDFPSLAPTVTKLCGNMTPEMFYVRISRVCKNENNRDSELSKLISFQHDLVGQASWSMFTSEAGGVQFTFLFGIEEEILIFFSFSFR